MPLAFVKHLGSFFGVLQPNGANFAAGRYHLCFSTRRDSPTSAVVPLLFFSLMDPTSIEPAGRVVSPGNCVRLAYDETSLTVCFIDSVDSPLAAQQTVVIELQFTLEHSEVGGLAGLLAAFNECWNGQAAPGTLPARLEEDSPSEGEAAGSGLGNLAGRVGVAPRIGQYSWTDARVTETLAAADAIPASCSWRRWFPV